MLQQVHHALGEALPPELGRDRDSRHVAVPVLSLALRLAQDCEQGVNLSTIATALKGRSA